MLVRGVVPGTGVVDLVPAGPVLHHLAEQVAERLLADGPDAAGRELEPALALLDEAGVLEHLGQLGQPLERPRRVVAQQLAGPFEVDLGQLAGLGGLPEQVLEVVHVAQRVEEARHLRHRQRVVAAEAHLPLPRELRERLLQVAAELVDLPAQVHVLEQRLGEGLELRALLGRHRVHELLHLRHRLRHLLEQLVERLRVAGEEVAVALHEPVEVGLLAALALLEHLVELGEHVLHPLHPLGREVLHALGHLVEVALHQLLAQLLHELLER